MTEAKAAIAFSMDAIAEAKAVLTKTRAAIVEAIG